MKKIDIIVNGVRVTLEVVDKCAFDSVVARQEAMEKWDYSSIIHLKEEAHEQMCGIENNIIKDNFSGIESIIEDMAWHEYLKNMVDDFEAGRKKEDPKAFAEKILAIEVERKMMKEIMEVH